MTLIFLNLNSQKFVWENCDRQLRCAGIFEIIRIRKIGWPVNFLFETFVSKYFPISPAKQPNNQIHVKAILENVQGLNSSDFSFGVTKVFFKTKGIEFVESQLKKSLFGSTVLLQKIARGFLCRKRFESMKKSSSLIQRNYRNYRRNRKFKRIVKMCLSIVKFTENKRREEKKRKEEEERKRKEEEERKRREEERRREEEKKKEEEEKRKKVGEQKKKREEEEKRRKEEEEKRKEREEKDRKREKRNKVGTLSRTQREKAQQIVSVHSETIRVEQERVKEQIVINDQQEKKLAEERSKLKKLDLSTEKKGAFPEKKVEKNKKTTQILMLSGLELDSLSPNISNCQLLVVLDLSRNLLSSLPPQICKLPCLEELDISNNNFSEFPLQIVRISTLKYLYLQNNQFTSLPAHIAYLSNLIKLNVSFNGLSTLPSHIGYLKLLQTLNLHNNQIEELPFQMACLLELNELSLENNKLTQLPLSLGNLRKLVNFSFDSEKIKFPPRSILEQGKMSVQVIVIYLFRTFQILMDWRPEIHQFYSVASRQRVLYILLILKRFFPRGFPSSPSLLLCKYVAN